MSDMVCIEMTHDLLLESAPALTLTLLGLLELLRAVAGTHRYWLRRVVYRDVKLF